MAVAAILSPVGAVSSAQAGVVKASPHGVAAVAPQSVASAARVPTIRVTPSTIMVGQRAMVGGRLPKVTSRTLFLQVRVGARWTNLPSSTRTTRSGYYAFRVFSRTPGTYLLRTLAPRVKIGKKVKAQSIGSARTVTVVAQIVSLSMPSTLTPTQSATATATFRPVRVGRPVSLQVFSNGAWETTALSWQSAIGTANFPVPAAMVAGTYQYRAVTAVSAGAPESGSTVHTVVVGP